MKNKIIFCIVGIVLIITSVIMISMISRVSPSQFQENKIKKKPLIISTDIPPANHKGKDSINAEKPSEQTPDPALKGLPKPLATLLDTTKGDTERNEAINSMRRSGYKGLTDDLIKVLDNPDEKERFRSFCIQHIYSNYEKADDEEKKKIRDTLYKGLGDRHVKVCRESLLGLVRIGDSKGKETTVKWLTGKDTDNVRDLAFRCAYKLDLKEHIPGIRKYSQNGNEVIRIASIVVLSQWGDEESRPAFEKATSSKSVRLQRAGKAALKRLDEKKKEKEKEADQSPTERVVF